MKYTLVFFFLFLFLPNFFSQVSEEWVMETILKNSPTAYFILSQYKLNGSSVSSGGQSTSSDMTHLKYCDLSSKERFLASIAITVHETTHAFDSQIPFIEANNNDGIVLSNSEGFFLDINNQFTYHFPKNNLFQSRLLAKTIPQNLRTFRYKEYIESNTYSQSTQSDGIIGLLEEFNAYYQGSKVTYDLLPVYKEVYGISFLSEWSFAVTSQADAFYEFDYFIKEYLLFAKSHYPALYEELRKDQNFKTIYKGIRTRFYELIVLYEKKYDDLNPVAQKQNGMHKISEKHTDLIYPILSDQIKSTRYLEIENNFLKN